MNSRWNDDTARDYRDRFAPHGDALALRLYTSHLLGQDPSLVLHGGGNTSVKTTCRDLLGRDVPVLCVKGSGSDLAAVGPEGMPAVRLSPLLELRALDRLDDAAMVNAVRSALLDQRAPNPSVETLLHAFLPHAFVDHTHANAILTLTDQPDPARHVRAALGEDVVLLPWIMPGFPLAKAVLQAFEQHPDCRGIVLEKHGLFTFGDDAKQSYERTIELVAAAQRYVDRATAGTPSMLRPQSTVWPVEQRRQFLQRVLPVLRGAAAHRVPTEVGPQWQRVVAEPRLDDELAAFAAHAAAADLCATGPITPDHVIRTKAHYLYLRRAEAESVDACRAAVARYVDGYQRYFEAHCRFDAGTKMLRPLPNVAVIEGIGVVALAATPAAAAIAADIAGHTLRVKAAAQDLDRYVALADAELACMEYWPLELAKLGSQREPPLHGQVAFVTGAAGAIGAGIVEALLAAGACVHATDIDAERLAGAMQRLAAHDARLRTSTADLCDPAAVEAAFGECVLQFGGVDCVVPNAGIAHTGRLEHMDAERFARVQAVNTNGTMHVLRAAAPILRAQGTGGSVVVQASKNVFAPGAGFGAYSASKAAVLQLARIAALEFAEFGVRVNVINADAVFGDDAVPSQLWQQVGPDRMKARGLDEGGLRAFYRDRSLLKQEVLPRHVGEAVVWFAAQRTPTTGAVLPVDGGIPEAFPR